VRELAAKFEAEHFPALRESTRRCYATAIKREILPAIGFLKVGAVSHDDVDRMHGG
jgi:hypothetical protein